MERPGRRFEVVPLAEVLEKTCAARQDQRIENGIPQSRGRESELVAVHAEHQRAATSSEPPLRARLKRVLVVDDERVIADTLTTILRHEGYEALTSYDGLSALSQCESFSPDLVISDVVMPEMNGVRMAVLVRQRYPSCKILLFSGQATTANLLEEARQSGYDFELLEKPINPKDLLARLAALARIN